MQRSNPKTATKGKRAQTKVTAINNAISDDKALDLFGLIAAAGMDGYDNVIIKTEVKLTRKQFYSRMDMLIRVGLEKERRIDIF